MLVQTSVGSSSDVTFWTAKIPCNLFMQSLLLFWEFLQVATRL